MVTTGDYPNVPVPPVERKLRGWYDWALVWRYWNGTAEGLRYPYTLEILELLRLGQGLSNLTLSEQLGVTERTVERWRRKYRSVRHQH